MTMKAGRILHSPAFPGKQYIVYIVAVTLRISGKSDFFAGFSATNRKS